MTPAERALNACVEYAKQSALIKDCKNTIGRQMEACHSENNGSVTRDLDTHLSMLLSHRFVTIEGGYMDPEEVKVFLSVSERDAILALCPHCAFAYEAIQIRKGARKALGNAKRAITLFGKARWEHIV